MLSWYSNYSNKININIDYTKYNNILLVNKNEEKIENKLLQIENEYENKLKELDVKCENDEYFNELKTKNSLIVLQSELEIIKLLTKYALQNNYLDYNFFIKSLKFLYRLSELLKDKLNKNSNIKINNDDTKNQFKKNLTNNLSRCSYKFCNYKESCVYNYDSKIKTICYQDHYVHHMVSNDLNILIQYIENTFTKQKQLIHNKEILKTLNTLSYVINHMENELKSKCMYVNEDEWESYHIIKV